MSAHQGTHVSAIREEIENQSHPAAIGLYWIRWRFGRSLRVEEISPDDTRTELASHKSRHDAHDETHDEHDA